MPSFPFDRKLHSILFFIIIALLALSFLLRWSHFVRAEDITDVQISGADSTQAVLTYTAPDTNPCTVEVSESPSFSPLVNDVNTALFPNANSDDRSGNITAGQQRIFVIGKRTAEKALDNKYYSRALQAYTTHYYRITCGSDSVTGNFQTTNIPIGNTAPELYPSDPNNPGAYAWPTIDWTDASKTYVDPLTGAQLKRISEPWTTFTSSNNACTSANCGAFNVSGNAWTSPGNAAVPDGSYATYSGSGQSPIFISLPSLGLSPDTNNPQDSLKDIQFKVAAYCNTADCVSNSAGQRNVDVCLTADGNSCASAWKTVTIGTSAGDTITYPSSFPNVGLQSQWLGGSFVNPLAHYQAAVRTGSSTVSGVNVTRTSGNYFDVDDWKAGSHIQFNGTDCVIQSVNGPNSLTLASSCGVSGSVSFTAKNFGLLLRKSTASADTINLDGVTYSYARAAAYEMPADGQTFMCSPQTFADGEGNSGSFCNFGNYYFFFIPASGTLRPLGQFSHSFHQKDANGNPTTMFGGNCNFATTATKDPNSPQDADFYCVSNSDSGIILIKAVYHGGNGVSGCLEPHDFQAISDSTAANCNVTWSVAGSYLDSLNAKDPAAYNSIKSGEVPYAYFDGKYGNYFIFSATNNQDAGTLLWWISATTTPLTTVSVQRSWSDYPMRWCVMHSLLPTLNSDGYDGLYVVKDMVGGNGVTFAGPYTVNITSVDNSANGSIPASLMDSCSAVTDPKWQAAGAVGNHCVTVNVDGDPCDYSPSTWEQANRPACSQSTSGRKLQAAQEGDNIKIDGERFLIAKVINPTQWVLLRNYNPLHYPTMDRSYSSDSQLQTHVASSTATFKCAEAIGGSIWDWVNPATGDMLYDRSHTPTAHGDSAGDRSIMVWGDPNRGYQLYYAVHMGPPSTTANQPADHNIELDDTFAGYNYGSTDIQSHLSYRQVDATGADKDWFLDFDPYGPNMGQGTGLWNFTSTHISGDLYKVSVPVALKRKIFPLAGFTGKYSLRDISGPNSAISGSASDNYKYCVADFAGECVRGSSASSVYVNIPEFDATTSCTRGLYDFHTPCLTNLGPEVGMGVQIGMNGTKWSQTERRLTDSLQAYGATWTYANMRASLTGEGYAFTVGSYLNGVRTDLLGVKLPPYPAPDGIDRSTFVPVTLDMDSVPVGTDNVVVDFGYAENGQTTDFYCTTRKEGCVANSSVINVSDPFHFAQSESYSGESCASGCEVKIPGLAQQVMYYQVEYRDNSGQVIATSNVGAVVPDYSLNPYVVTPPGVSGLAISGVAASASSTSAAISWTTSVPADSLVKYGTSTAYASSSSYSTSTVSHLLSLTGLTPSTTYHYMIQSKDQSGDTATSTDSTFITKAATSNGHLIISSTTAANITQNSAVISWMTNVPASSLVKYGTSTAYGRTAPPGATGGTGSTVNATVAGSPISFTNLLAVKHSVILNGLASSTTYHYLVQSKDQAGEMATSTDYAFTTLGSGKSVPTPVISAVHATNVSTSTASIVWATNVPASSLVKYGTSTAYGRTAPPGITGGTGSAIGGPGTGSAINATNLLATKHSVSLAGLLPSTTYHYMVQSSDVVGHTATSADATFTTSSLGKGILPPIVSSVHVINVSTSTASIAWTTNEPANSVVGYGLSSASNLTSLFNTILTMDHVINLGNLFASSTYHYVVQSKDQAGNAATSTGGTFTTAPTSTSLLPPTISAVSSYQPKANSPVAVTASLTAEMISWTTDQPADSQVFYGNSSSTLSLFSALNPASVVSHSVYLSSLHPKTQYYYQVQSKNAGGLLSTSDIFVFTTY